LVTDDKIFLSYFGNNNYRASLQIIDRKTGLSHTSEDTPSGDNQSERFKSACGRIEWWNSTTIVMLAWKRILLYDTEENAWSYIPIDPYALCNVGNPVRKFYDFAVGESMVCATDEPYFGNTYNLVYLFDKQTGEGTCITVEGLNSANTWERYGIVQYSNGKFFICYHEALVIINEKTKQIEKKVTGMPWGSPAYMQAYNNNVVIGVNSDKYKIYVYDARGDRFNMFYGKWNPGVRYPSSTRSESYNGYTIYNTYHQMNSNYRFLQPVVTGGLCFIPWNTMAVVDLTSNAVYEMGEKFNRYLLPFDESNADNIEYDERFVDLSGSCLRVHNGIISKHFESSSYGSNIKKVEISKSEYTSIISGTITFNED
jgi:hypothetical protein